MKRLMFVSAGQLPPSTAQDEWVDLKLLEKGKVPVIELLLSHEYWLVVVCCFTASYSLPYIGMHTNGLLSYNNVWC